METRFISFDDTFADNPNFWNIYFLNSFNLPPDPNNEIIKEDATQKLSSGGHKWTNCNETYTNFYSTRQSNLINLISNITPYCEENRSMDNYNINNTVTCSNPTNEGHFQNHFENLYSYPNGPEANPLPITEEIPEQNCNNKQLTILSSFKPNENQQSDDHCNSYSVNHSSASISNCDNFQSQRLNISSNAKTFCRWSKQTESDLNEIQIESNASDLLEMRRSRYLETIDFLKRTNLMEITMQTIDLLKRNKLLQKKIDTLRDEHFSRFC